MSGFARPFWLTVLAWFVVLLLLVVGIWLGKHHGDWFPW
jgi:Mn2+/Fe2+ NRAMP family transporter